MKVQEKKRELQPLRSLSKELYHHLLTELAKSNIHSYDVEAYVFINENSYEITLHYGNHFTNTSTGVFTKGQMMSIDDEITDFFKESTEIIKKTMIQEYYKMMKP